ncbi:glycosyltransferase family 2 protein [Caulobacter sp. 17J65-9]|uniref:glycosyltransferase family 2 protein n=1 Tax=Caulobacter sp. 17J65-9 TaxID=2709382 RepID=UPI0013C718D1|nr:glycosyltransferase family 2 protein [Caulobacter sp. 17J65-9]NEX92348.1 glycosyltransferase family 2 protein [Caulobacter sp. 17J65-9]
MPPQLRNENAEDETSKFALSICIPSYNRRALIEPLVRELLSFEGPFEVCVHVDGSTDGTESALRAINDHRLSVSAGQNRGSAEALLSAFRLAKGRYVMPFNDDDHLYRDGLKTIIHDCISGVPQGCAGFIYHLEDERGARVGSDFPKPQSNFLELRADYKVKGDKKEVVLAEPLRSALGANPRGFRRIPMSSYWSKIALRHDVICRDHVVGQKKYLADGLTANISRIKNENALPMAKLYAIHIVGYTKGRYRSLPFLAKAIAGLLVYSIKAIAFDLFKATCAPKPLSA